MRAAVFKEVGRPLSIENVPDPVPGPSEVVVKIGRCGICGTDLHLTEGDGMTYPLGTIPGHEFAGEVVALGKGVEGIQLGDIVAAQPKTGCGECPACLAGEPKHCPEGVGIGSAFAQYTRAGFRECVRLPASLSLADGALIEPLAVGLHAVILAQIVPGARVLVVGAGPIGLATGYWASRAGASRIAMMARSRRHESYAEAMGITHYLTLGENPAAETSEALGNPPDIVFECVGRPGMIHLAMTCVARKGTVVVLGFCPSADTIGPGNFLFKELKLIYSNTYSTREFEIVADAMDRGGIEPRSMITDTVSLDDLPPVFETLRGSTHQCKVMIDPWQGTSGAPNRT